MNGVADLFGFTAPAAACGVACAGLLTRATFAPASALWGPVVSHGGDDAPHVALTFDDGPTQGATDRVLDALGEHGVRAAFFVVGRNAERFPALVERIDAEGHVVGNHTWDHSHYGVFGRDRYWRDQLARTDRLIEQIIGKRPRFFRPPMGIKTWHVTDAARGARQTVVTWNRRAMDGLETEAARIVDRLVPSSRPGDILLLHDGLEPHARRRDARATEQAMRPLVAGLRERGLEPRRLDELLGMHAYRDGSDSGGGGALSARPIQAAPVETGVPGRSSDPPVGDGGSPGEARRNNLPATAKVTLAQARPIGTQPIAHSATNDRSTVHAPPWAKAAL